MTAVRSVGTIKLPGGTSKFYREDGTFVTPPAGVGGGSASPSTNDFILSLVSADPAYAPQVLTASSTDTTAETVTFASDHGWVSGTIVYVNLTAGGLTRGTKYYVNAASSTSVSFHTTVADALAGTNKVNLSANITDPIIPTGIAGTTLYLTPRIGNNVGLYDGAAWAIYASAERSIALGTLTASLPYDVFLYDNSGTLTLELLAWTSGTVRATALVRQDGVWLKTGALTRRYIGTIYTMSTTTTEDSEENRCVYTPFVPIRWMLRQDRTADDWTYTTNTLRQAHADTNNQLQVLTGLPGITAHVLLDVWGQTTASGRDGRIAIGYNSTTTNYPKSGATQGLLTGTMSDFRFKLTATLVMPMPIGIQQFVWLESALTSCTFAGTRPSVPYGSTLSCVFN